jgi:hypothetical protein
MTKITFANGVITSLVPACLIALGCSAPPSKDEANREAASVSQALEAPIGEILFQDDFSDPGSGWKREDEDYQKTDYRDGVYIVRFKDTRLITRVAYPGEDLLDGYVQVDATVSEGTGGTYGVYARYTKNRLLRCIVNDKGEAALQLAVYEDYSVPSPTFEPHEAVRSGTNRIAMRFEGKSVTCLVNGVLVQAIQDPEPKAGALGLVAGNGDEAFEVRFDHFLLTSVKD